MRNLLLAFGLMMFGLVATAEAAPQCVIVYSLGEVKFSGCTYTQKESIKNALQAIEARFTLEEDLEAANQGSAEYFHRNCRRNTLSLEGFDKCASQKALPKKLEVDHHQLRWYIWRSCEAYSDNLDRLARCAKIIGFNNGRGPGWLVDILDGYETLKGAKLEARDTLQGFRTCNVGEDGVGVICEPPAQSGAGPLVLWTLIVAFFRRWREEKQPQVKWEDDAHAHIAPVDPKCLPGSPGRRHEWVLPTLTTAFVVAEIAMGDWVGVIFGLIVFLIEKLGVFK